jgi:hypothetical protein
LNKDDKDADFCSVLSSNRRLNHLEFSVNCSWQAERSWQIIEKFGWNVKEFLYQFSNPRQHHSTA